MPRWFLLAPVSALLAFALACSSPVGTVAGKSHRGAPADTEEATSPPAASDSETPARATGPLGVVAIDLQQVFFDTAGRRNPRSDLSGRMAKSAHLFEVAAAHHVPLVMTFEASTTGDHALPPSLASAWPAGAPQLVKTTFAATGQPQFLPAVQASGARRLLVVGAETDVCIMQTMLGLRRAGYEVLAVTDALFTEEVNTAPALRRMRQAGIVEIDTAGAEALLASGGSSPAPETTAPPVVLKPLETGILLHDVEGLGATDPNASAKMVRLRELLLISEWFHLPVLAENPTNALAALPQNLRSVLTRPIVPLANRPSQVTQLAIAGGHQGIAQAAADLRGKVDLFLIEDALLGGGSTDLEPLYVAGAVPTTYKTLYYELIQSVSEAGWPSKQWVTDGSRYFDLTMAPEELPPLVSP